jgi:hypothetical protein
MKKQTSRNEYECTEAITSRVITVCFAMVEVRGNVLVHDDIITVTHKQGPYGAQLELDALGVSGVNVLVNTQCCALWTV